MLTAVDINGLRTLQVLNCSDTDVTSLAPLATCTALTDLDCSYLRTLRKPLLRSIASLIAAAALPLAN